MVHAGSRVGLRNKLGHRVQKHKMDNSATESSLKLFVNKGHDDVRLNIHRRRADMIGITKGHTEYPLLYKGHIEYPV